MRAGAHGWLARGGWAMGETREDFGTKGVLFLDQALPEDAIVGNAVFQPP